MTAADRIRQRIAEKREEYAEYLAHARLRLREEDLHGLWDCGANASEVSNYIDGLTFALGVLFETHETTFGTAPPGNQRCGMPMQLGLACELQAGHSDCHVSTEGQAR